MLVPYHQKLTTLQIVSSSIDSELAGISDAEHALWMGPDSLTTTLDYARTHYIVTDEDWPRIAAVGTAAIDKFVGDTAVDESNSHGPRSCLPMI